MIRLDLTADPRWLDLGHGVRIKVAAPLTTAIMIAARNDAAIRDMPADASEEAKALAFAKVVARRVILEWEGVGDAEGNPIEPTPAGIDALMECYPIFEAFQLRYVAKGIALDAEKNASAPLPNGISAGASDIARLAKDDALNAPRS